MPKSTKSFIVPIRKCLFKRGRSKKINLSATYSIKPRVEFNGKNVWPEIAMLLHYKKQGYNGVWVDAFHKKYWKNEREKTGFRDLPLRIQKLIDKGCWDLVIWKGKRVKFIELKGLPSKDKIRQNQLAFMNKMLDKGTNPNCFEIVEWDYK